MKLKIFIMALIVVLIIIFFIGIYGYYHFPAEVLTQDFDFEVSGDAKRIGFNVDPDKLHFGTLCSGCSASRKLNLINNASYDKKIEFYFSSKEYLPERTIRVAPFSGTIIPKSSEQQFEVKIFPTSLFVGNYTGTLIIKLYRVFPLTKYFSKQQKISLGACWSDNLMEILSCD